MTAPSTAPSRWWEHAACTGTDQALWFPGTGQGYGTAVWYCARCPVREACLDDALATDRTGDSHGMRAGLTPNERDAITRGELTPAQALDQALADIEPQETTVTVTDITPDTPRMRINLVPETPDALIEWASGANQPTRLQSLAGKARRTLTDLRTEAEREAKVADAAARVERLEAQLANAKKDLVAAKSPKSKPATTTTGPKNEDYAAIRAWARENGIRVPERGIPKREIRDAYYAAHNAA